jgi:HSP90 family molecular chaperone
VGGSSGDKQQYRWESSAGDSFTIVEDDGEPIEGSGTRITLHLKVSTDCV